MKITKLLHRRRGFTLVECVIAIAVFAVLTSMVIMIIGNTVKLSKEASDAESDLNLVVQNVVEDNSHNVYGADSHTLNMVFGDSASETNFRMTYSAVDGNKKFIQCPNPDVNLTDSNPNDPCEAVFAITDYLSYIYGESEYTGASDADKSKYKISHWFNPASTTLGKYICPECGYIFHPSDIYAVCEGCTRSGSLSTFDYNTTTGNYVCPTCHGEQIVQRITVGSNQYLISDFLKSDSQFNVSGISANALRYGEVKQIANKADVVALSTLEGGTSPTSSVTLSYTPSATPTKPGEYTLSIPSVSGLSSTDSGSIKLWLPGCYTPRITYTNADGSGTNALAQVEGSLHPEKAEEHPLLKITNLNSGNSSGIVVKFTLINYANGNSFEDDYKYDAGALGSGQTVLSKYWFKASSNSLSLPRDESTVSG